MTHWLLLIPTGGASRKQMVRNKHVKVQEDDGFLSFLHVQPHTEPHLSRASALGVKAGSFLVCTHVGQSFCNFACSVLACCAWFELNSSRRLEGDWSGFNDSATAGRHHHCRAPACPGSHRLNTPWAGCSPLQSTHTCTRTPGGGGGILEP